MNRTSLPKRIFGSVGVAAVTPFFEDGFLDVDSAVALANKLIDDGYDLILLSGATGESPTTYQPEKGDLTREVVASLKGRGTKVMADAGSNDTAHAVRIARGTQANGAEALLVLPLYYNRPSQRGVYQHILAVTEASDLPVVFYDIPGRTGVKLDAATLLRFAEHPRIIDVKDATDDATSGFIKMERIGLEYYSGDDSLNFAWLAHGASGVISVAGHVIGSGLHALVTEIDAGGLPATRAEAAKQRPIVEAIMGGGQGTVMAKKTLKLLGALPSATFRLPLVGAPTSQIAELAAALRAEGLMQAFGRAVRPLRRAAL